MKKKGTFLMTIGFLLLMSAAVLTGYNIYESMRAEKISNTAVQEMVSVIENTEVDEEEIPEYEIVPDKEMPTLEIDKERYLGILQIPELNLSLPVMSGEWSYAKLKKAPCRYYGSVYENNMVIAGHNYRSHFSRIKNLDIGSELQFIDVEGNVFYYRVGWIEILQPEDVEAMNHNEECDLTLFTCTYGGSERYTVRCIRQK